MDIRNERDPMAEALAASLIAFAGGQESEKITRTKLIELGIDNLKEMARALIESIGNSDNTTSLGKLERYAAQISRGELVHNEDASTVPLNLTTEALLMKLITPEMLADIILKLSGIQGKAGLMNETLRAKYPDMNKAKLVALGKDNLLQIIRSYSKSEADVDSVDNRVPIAKLNDIMKDMRGQDEDKFAGIKEKTDETIFNFPKKP